MHLYTYFHLYIITVIIIDKKLLLLLYYGYHHYCLFHHIIPMYAGELGELIYRRHHHPKARREGIRWPWHYCFVAAFAMPGAA